MASRPDEAAKQPLNRRWIIRASAQDDQAARARAARAGVRFSDYVRRVSVEGRLVTRRDPASAQALAALTTALNRAGNLVNQQMSIAHINGELPRELLRATDALAAAVEAILTQFNPRGT